MRLMRALFNLHRLNEETNLANSKICSSAVPESSIIEGNFGSNFLIRQIDNPIGSEN